MSKHILIVGKNFSTLKNYILDKGYGYTVLQDELATKFPEKRLKNRVVSSFSTESEVLSGLSKIHKPIDAVISIYENYVLPAAWISKQLGLPGMTPASAEACTDKEIMRQKFDTSPEKISPAFQVVGSQEALLDFASKHTYPLILKPANLAKSLLVTKNNTRSELIENYQKAIELLNGIYKKYAPNRSPKLIVEEYLEGSIHSVDAFVDQDGIPHILKEVVDYKTGYDIGYDDNFHYSRRLPSVLDDSNQRALQHCANLGIRALGMRSSPAHVEIIMTSQGPRIVEIGARNGGYRERMHGLANGIDIIGNALEIALGNQPSIDAERHDNCAVLELFPKEPGYFTGIDNYDKLLKLSSLTYISIKVKPGEFIGKSSDGFKMSAVVILHSSSQRTIENDLQFIQSSVKVAVSPTQNISS